MNRRAFVTGLGAVFAAPLGVEAQQAGKVYRIGLQGVTPPTSPPVQRLSEALLQALRDHGLVEGQNVIIERRYSEGREDRHTAFAAEFVQMKVDLIIAASSAAAHAAKQATSTPTAMITRGSDPSLATRDTWYVTWISRRRKRELRPAWIRDLAGDDEQEQGERRKWRRRNSRHPQAECGRRQGGVLYAIHRPSRDFRSGTGPSTADREIARARRGPK